MPASLAAKNLPMPADLLVAAKIRRYRQEFVSTGKFADSDKKSYYVFPDTVTSINSASMGVKDIYFGTLYRAVCFSRKKRGVARTTVKSLVLRQISPSPASEKT